MSRRKYNQLVKAGEVPLGYIIFPTEGIDLTSNTKAQMEAVQDEKINFIDYYQNRIAYQESTDQPTENFRDVLANLPTCQLANLPTCQLAKVARQSHKPSINQQYRY